MYNRLATRSDPVLVTARAPRIRPSHAKMKKVKQRRIAIGLKLIAIIVLAGGIRSLFW